MGGRKKPKKTIPEAQQRPLSFLMQKKREISRQLKQLRETEISQNKDLFEAQGAQSSKEKKKIKNRVEEKDKGHLIESQNEQPPSEKKKKKKKKKKNKEKHVKEKEKLSIVQDDVNSLNNDVGENGRTHKVCLLFTEAETCSLTLLIIEEGRDFLSSDSFSTLKLAGHCFPDVGFGSLESKCYVIGGDVYPHGKSLRGLKLPRKVFVCNLDRTIRSWEEGPMLIGGKPNPVVATVNGRLYALGGTSDLWKGPHEKLTTVFEVFEPKYGMWRVLPKPPFLSLYKKGFPHPEFRGNTVIGSVIYVQIGDISDPVLYSFNVDSERWTEYSGGSDVSSYEDGSDELVIHNMRIANWVGQSDVVDYLMFRTSGNCLENLNVYAYDLTRNIVNCENEDNKLVFGDDNDTSKNEVMDFDFWTLENDFYFLDDESLVNFEFKKISFQDEDQVSSESNNSIEEGQLSFQESGGVGESIEDGQNSFVEHIVGEGESIIEEGEDSFRDGEDSIGEGEDGIETGEVKDSMTREGGVIPSKYKCHDYKKGEYVLMVDGYSLTIPIFGLTHIDRFVYPISALTSFVTHLGNNLFSLVLSYPYRNYKNIRTAHVRVCIFESSFIEISDGVKLTERYVVGHNVREFKWMEPETDTLIGCCKVPNDGHQSQLRRPQLQYGKKSSGYPDYVAGKIIEKKNTFHRYVRRVNLPVD